MLHFVLIALNEVVGRILLQAKKSRNAFFVFFKSKTWYAENLFLTSYIDIYTC